MTATVTSDFREEYEAERLQWLRRRFLWYTGILGGLGGLSIVVSIVPFFFQSLHEQFPLLLGLVALNVVETILFFSFFAHVRRATKPFSRKTLVRFVFWLIVINGVLQVPATPMSSRVREIAPGAAALQIDTTPAKTPPVPADQPADAGAPASSTSTTPSASQPKKGAPPMIRFGASWLGGVFVSHLLASLFIPWTPREAMRPLAPLLVLFAILMLLFGEGPLTMRVVWVAAAPLIGVPGVAWSAWRANLFRTRFHARVLRRSYREMRRELVDARNIHEDLFPAPITKGAVRMVYRYEPMRQIGGDFLFSHRFPGIDGDPTHEALSVVMIDVTGHGIPAALTVNRLSGELERLYAEDPDVPPGDVLTALNNYVHYTMATHSVYATALCLRLDPDLDVLEWASGGHPPAFLRSVDGCIDRLDSTAFVLGACHGEDFQHGQQSIPFARGDTLIAYTDGAIEARNNAGRMMGVEGFQKLVASLHPDAGEENGWASAILRAVEQHRFGPPEDDTLIVELYRPLTV